MSVVPVDARSASATNLSELYERHADRIFRFCRRRLRSRQEAEDAVQETFVSALRALQRGCVPVSESAWLLKIAENVCYATYRSNARRESRLEQDELAGVPAHERSDDNLVGFEHALQALPANQRHAFVLRELRGLSYEEIANRLGVSVSSVEALLYRSRRSLARTLASGGAVRGRLTASANLGSVFTALKAWLAGATGVKVATAAAVAAVATVSVGDTVPPAREPATHAPAVVPAPVAARKSAVWGSSRDSREAASAPAASPATPSRQAPPRRGGRPTRDVAPPTPARPGRQHAPTTPTPVAESPASVPEGAPGASTPDPSPPPVALPEAPPTPQPALPLVGDLPVSGPQAPSVPEVPSVPLPVDVPEVQEILPDAPKLP